MVALERTSQGFLAHGLYSSTFLEPDDMTRFPDLKNVSLPRYPEEKKHLGFVSGRRSKQVPIDSIVLPRVVAGIERSKLRRATPMEVLLKLGPSTIQVGKLSSGRIGFELLADLAERVPGYHLDLGSDVPQALACLLD